MELTVERKWNKKDYTVGNLYINGSKFCNTLEDTNRNLYSFMSEYQIAQIKVYGKTAIPYGTYDVDMETISPKYSTRQWYVQNCRGGRMPRIKGVRGFQGILIHPGNTADDSLGCLLVGRNTQVGRLTDSKATFKKLYDIMADAHRNGEKITIKFTGAL